MPRKATPRTQREAMSPERKMRFLKALEAGMDFRAAAMFASTLAKTPQGAVTTFERLLDREPEFAEICARAQARARNRATANRGAADAS